MNSDWLSLFASARASASTRPVSGIQPRASTSRIAGRRESSAWRFRSASRLQGLRGCLEVAAWFYDGTIASSAKVVIPATQWLQYSSFVRW